MNCPERHILTSLADGDLASDTARQVRDHLVACADCRSVHDNVLKKQSHSLDQLRSTDETLPVVDDVILRDTAGSFSATNAPQIDGYQIVSVLGHGGMGVVYRAVQVKLNRAVALKVLPAMIGSASQTAISRFRREATAAAKLHHTNIVPVYDFGESKDGYYYAMELIEGLPLDAVIRYLARNNAASASAVRLAEMLHALTKKTQRSETASLLTTTEGDLPTSPSTTSRSSLYFQQVARWVADAADAIDYAHKQGIIHRDLKPANLILAEDGRIMLTDFGLAKQAGDQSMTRTGDFVGSLRYVSPEQAMSKRVRVDHRTDIYSLGATMYELLCFQPAFDGDDEKEILGAVISRDPARPRRIVPLVPSELETICMKTMEKQADARYATAHALADDLRRYMNDLPIVARRPGPIRRTYKFVRRHRAAVIAGFFLALLLLAMPLVVVSRRTAKKEQTRALALELVTMAHDAQREDNWSDAATYYREAIRIDATDHSSLISLAHVLKELYNSQVMPDDSMLEEAVSLCNRASHLAPDVSHLWNTLGVCLKKLKRYGEAIAAYERALQLDNKSSLAWENLGIVLALDDRLELAEVNIKKAADLAGTTEVQCESPWRNLAAIALHRRDRAVESYLDNALVCNHLDSDALCLRAKLRLEWSEQEDFIGALQDADRANYAAAGKNTRAKRILALAQLRNGNFVEAISEAEAADLLPGAFASANQLIAAIAMAKLGRMSDARVNLEEAIAAWPANFDEVDITAPKGILWFESPTSLQRLRAEAEELIGSASGQ